MMFLSIWLCDTFEFVFGSTYGVKKLIPLVSPNKTWFGSICGLLSSFIVPLIFYLYYPIVNINFSDYMIFGLIFGVLGQLGDLSISLLKSFTLKSLNLLKLVIETYIISGLIFLIEL